MLVRHRQRLKLFSLEIFLLAIVFLISFALRLYKIDIPLADHHSWRQADTAAVARNYVKDGFSFFYPRIDNMSPLHSPDVANDQRLFFTELPIYNAFVAALYKVLGVDIKWARLASILFSLLSLVFLYRLVKEFSGKLTAFFSVLFFGLMPFNVFYSRAVLPEAMMVFFNMAMIYFWAIWLRKQGRSKNAGWAYYLLSLFFTALSLTQKVFSVFLAVPMAYLALKSLGFNGLKKKWYLLLIFALVALLPLLFWRWHMSRFSAGIPPFDWLFNQGGIRLRPAWWWWLFGKRLAELIGGYWLLVIFGVGWIVKPSREEGWLYYVWGLAAFLYLVVLARGNVTHDYYQLPLIPIVCVFLGRGAAFLARPRIRLISPLLSWGLLFFSLVMGLAFSWKEVVGFYNIQGGVDLAGQAVDRLAGEHDLVVAGDGADATLLYNTNRHGWTVGFASAWPVDSATIEMLRDKGARFFVTTKLTELRESFFGKYMREHYRVVEETDQYIIFDLGS